MKSIISIMVSIIIICVTTVFGSGIVQAQTAAPGVTSADTKGYLVANYTIRDQNLFKQYMDAAGSLAAKFDGAVIIYDTKAEILEGKPEAIIAVAEFSSVAKTEQFYNSVEYTSARKFRISSTKGSVLLATGLPDIHTVATSQPKGYLVANYTIKDQVIFQKYMDAAGALAPKFNGTVIIYDVKSRTLEGNPKSVIAVAEFPSVEEAKKFYDSPEYSGARKFRIASTEGSVVLAEGLPQKKSTAPAALSAQEVAKFMADTVNFFSYSTRVPILRTPDEYGLKYEDVYFPAVDGVPIEGWFIPANSDRLIIMNHPMPANRYGYPGHLDPWKNFGGFEVNFLPEYKILHDAGYNILTYDMRNHGRSGAGSGGLVGHGLFEYRDVLGSLDYVRSRKDAKKMKIALYSRCLGAASTFVAMKKHPEAFKNIKAMLALQPVTPKVFLETAMESLGIENGINIFSIAYYEKTGLHLDQVWPLEYAKAVTIPTMVAQVRRDFLTKQSNVQEIYDTISSKDKKLFWIEATDQRFEGYNYFGKNPQLMLEWFDSHMK